MAESQQPEKMIIYGYDGNPYNRHNLLTFKRWTPNRKALVLEGLRRGMITEEELLRISKIDELELLEWKNAYSTNGINSLRIKKGYDARHRRSGRE